MLRIDSDAHAPCLAAARDRSPCCRRTQSALVGSAGCARRSIPLHTPLAERLAHPAELEAGKEIQIRTAALREGRMGAIRSAAPSSPPPSAISGPPVRSSRSRRARSQLDVCTARFARVSPARRISQALTSKTLRSRASASARGPRRGTAPLRAPVAPAAEREFGVTLAQELDVIAGAAVDQLELDARALGRGGGEEASGSLRAAPTTRCTETGDPRRGKRPAGRRAAPRRGTSSAG